MLPNLIQSETENVKERLLYVDNLRLLVIVLVVTIHLAVTVSGLGSWYYVYGTHLDTLSTVWFAFYQSFTQGYFMGLLFMISGYFVAGSYDRKGFGSFTKDRFKRLIVPTLIFMIAITPFIEIVELGNKFGGFNLVAFFSGTGPMWFAAALFGFSLIYGLVRVIGGGPDPASKKKLSPTLSSLVALILVIAIFAFLIRIVQPIGTDVLNFQLCYFASYVVLFVVGIMAYRSNLFAQITYRVGKRLLVSAIVLGLIAWFILVAIATKTGTTTLLLGGLTWQSAVYSLWESFIAVSVSLGLIAVFREKFNHQNKVANALSNNAFAVYMFHPMIIIPVTLLFSSLALYPIAKWLLLCIVSVPLCFAATHFVFRRIPLLKRVL